MNASAAGHPLDWAGYWRNSLADAELATGALQNVNDKLLWRPPVELETGIVEEKVVATFFKDIEPAQETVEVTLRPFVFALRLEHGKKKGNLPEHVAPVMVKAAMDRAGRLYPEPLSGMARDLLEPQDGGGLTIAALEDVDRELSERPVNGFSPPPPEGAEDFDYPAAWSKFRSGCEQLLQNTSGNWPGTDAPYRLYKGWLLGKVDETGGSSLHILPLYDHLRTQKVVPPLFAQYAAEDQAPAEPCLPANANFVARLAHASDQYPLVDAQRDGLAHFLETKAGDILAVNGPPGTGKTTLLLSVVACLWAKAALDGGDPPIIVATSTNNQAVTNVIDAFGKDFSAGSGPFAGRWLPKINSFGAYLPASHIEGKAAQKYQTKAFFNSLETPEYVNDAQEAFLARAAIAYPGLKAGDLEAVVEQLRQDIRSHVDQLERLNTSWEVYGKARGAVFDELGDTPDAAQAARVVAADQARALHQSFVALDRAWEDYLGHEPMLLSLFSWIGPVGRKRLARARTHFRDRWPRPSVATEWETVQAIEDAIRDSLRAAEAELEVREREEQAGEQVLAARHAMRAAWLQTAACLFMPGAVPENVTLADCDRLADTQIRFPVFLLTTHYWEGRWLLTMAKVLPKLAAEANKTGRTVAVPRWQRRMMITPAVVATCYRLPTEMSLSKRENNGFVTQYLYDFADLLIVDEAGQVLPEVAGASFALAKRALVIGDTLQLEPIWKIPAAIDAGNLRSSGMLGASRTYDALRALGKTSAGGSVMAIAQQRSRYHYDPDFPRGMMLYEHRRCYDEIIGYCNDLCYHGKLIPKRGPAKNGGNLPTMGYLHINGRSEARPGQSRWNLLEAETIAAWIAAHREELEAGYDRKIHEIVGVLSPFTGQVKKIVEACVANGIPAGRGEGELTVGTVNALQGAERPIVIFSPTYSKHSDGSFIDSRQSMLNVAVSRAKDNFLVFGDMDIFNPRDRQKPRGLLAAKLFAHAGNAMTFEALLRKDLCTEAEEGPRYLRDAIEHDHFLLSAIERATARVVIVSPWLRRQRIEEAGIYQAMAAAVKRGVDVSVYGSRSDTDDAGEGHWQSCVTSLSEAGIAVRNVHRLHAKILMADDDLIAIGSFNWLSAARSGQFAKHEVSAVYTGSNCAEEIAIELGWLERQGD